MWMTFIVQPEGPELLKKYIEYYEQRSCKVTINPEGAKWDSTTLSIMVPSPCLYLDRTTGRCTIYAERPALCWEYDGRWDPHMRGICKLPVEPQEDTVIEVGTEEGPNPFYQCPFCGQLDPGELVCMGCGKLMKPPEEELDG